MNLKLKIGTINVRGLADETKRKQLFKTWECKYNILFLNETHCDNSKEKRWSDETNYDSIWSNQAYNAGGCAILSNIGKPETIFKSNNGRIIISTLNIPNIGEVCLVCGYAPTQNFRKNQIEFLNTLKQKLEPIEIPILLGGDINVCLSKLDKKGGSDLKYSMYRNEFLKFLMQKGLTDIYRAHHADKKEFTWRDRCRGGVVVQERLDYIFVPKVYFIFGRKL